MSIDVEHVATVGEHFVEVRTYWASTGSSSHRTHATCRCGWKGKDWADKRRAIAEGKRHAEAQRP